MKKREPTYMDSHSDSISIIHKIPLPIPMPSLDNNMLKRLRILKKNDKDRFNNVLSNSI